MSETPAGRRDNGLHAPDYGALVDLDPRLADGLLSRLADAGVAAYVEPASAADPFSRASLPSRPLDRLWVDPDNAEAARTVVAAEVADLSALLAENEPGATAHGLVLPVPRHAARRVLTPPPLPDPPRSPAPPAPAPLDEDEVFRQIVAGFDRDEPGPVDRWPVSEDLDGPSSSDVDAARRRRPPVDRQPRRRRDDPPLPQWLEPDALEPEPEDAGVDHYVPPPPPPAPRVRLRTLGGLGVLALGLVLVFLPGLVGQGSTPGTLLLGVALLGAGAWLLVLQVRDAPPLDSGPDDGAVV